MIDALRAPYAALLLRLSMGVLFILHGLYIKAMVFGFIVSAIACRHGFFARGGARGVGLATTRAVVGSCVLVLVSDYVLANVLFRLIFAS